MFGPETIHDSAKMNLVSHPVWRLSWDCFEPCGLSSYNKPAMHGPKENWVFFSSHWYSIFPCDSTGRGKILCQKKRHSRGCDMHCTMYPINWQTMFYYNSQQKSNWFSQTTLWAAIVYKKTFPPDGRQATLDSLSILKPLILCIFSGFWIIFSIIVVDGSRCCGTVCLIP